MKYWWFFQQTKLKQIKKKKNNSLKWKFQAEANTNAWKMPPKRLKSPQNPMQKKALTESIMTESIKQL